MSIGDVIAKQMVITDKSLRINIAVTELEAIAKTQSEEIKIMEKQNTALHMELEKTLELICRKGI